MSLGRVVVPAIVGRCRDLEPVPVRVVEVDAVHDLVVDGTEHLDAAPVVIAACLDIDASGTDDPAARYGSILPAVQNLCLAARAAGLGTVLTTLARRQDAAVRVALGIPGGIEVVALVPLGWPQGGFPAARRRAVAETTFADEWGRPRPPPVTGV